jgi:hypothetical protein
MASVFVLGIAKGFSDVVQEDGEADEGVGRCVRKRAQGMLQDVVAMVFCILFKAAAGEKLGEELADDVHVFTDHVHGVHTAEELRELLADAFGGDEFEKRLFRADGGFGFFIQGKAEDRRESEGAQDTESVLAEASYGVTHAADDSVLQVFASAEEVHEATIGVIGHGVDGKIATREVILHGFGEGDAYGMAVVEVDTIVSEGCNLDGGAVHEDGKGSVLKTGFDDAEVTEALCDLLGESGGGHVPVIRGTAEEGIPDATADDEGEMTV